MALEIFDIFSLLSLRVIKALNVLFKIDDDLVFVLNLPLKILVLERKLSDGLLLGELGCVKSSVSWPKIIDLILEDCILIFQ